MSAVAVAWLTGDPSIESYLTEVNDNPGGLILATTFMVGLGTNLCSGCTSGHGVMGMAWFAKRSIVATCLFLSSAVAAATFLRPAISPFLSQGPSTFPGDTAVATLVPLAFAGLAGYGTVKHFQKSIRSTLTAFGCGALFGLGLIVSGMMSARKIAGFLDVRPLFSNDVSHSWDPSMIVVMGSALITNGVSLAVQVPRGTLHNGEPAAIPGHCKCIPTDTTTISKKLLIGSVMFGLGWGFTGGCVGPMLVNTFTGGVAPALSLIGLTAGVLVGMKVGGTGP